MSKDHQSYTEMIGLVGDHSASAAPWVRAFASTTYTCAKRLSVVVSMSWRNETQEGWDRFLPYTFQDPSAARPRDAQEPCAGEGGDWWPPLSATAVCRSTGRGCVGQDEGPRAASCCEHSKWTATASPA